MLAWWHRCVSVCMCDAVFVHESVCWDKIWTFFWAFFGWRVVSPHPRTAGCRSAGLGLLPADRMAGWSAVHVRQQCTFLLEEEVAAFTAGAIGQV